MDADVNFRYHDPRIHPKIARSKIKNERHSEKSLTTIKLYVNIEKLEFNCLDCPDSLQDQKTSLNSR